MDDGIADYGKWAAYIASASVAFIAIAAKVNSLLKSERRQISQDANRDEWEARDLARDKAKDERIALLEKAREDLWEGRTKDRAENSELRAENTIWRNRVEHTAELHAVTAASLKSANDEIQRLREDLLHQRAQFKLLENLRVIPNDERRPD